MAASTIVETTAPAKADDEVSLVTKETVPQSFIDRIKTHPLRKLPPLSQEEIQLYDEFFPDEPKAITKQLDSITVTNYMVDLEHDCLRQYEEKGYAEVGVDFTKGIKQIFILPHKLQHQPQPEVMVMQQGNGRGGGRSKTKLMFVSGFGVMFALVVVLLSCSLMSRLSVQV